MARQPDVFVRKLDPGEAQRLVKITRTARDRVRLRRWVIHAFNTQGFAALDPRWSGGRPRRFGLYVRELICRVARTPPQQAGRPLPPGA
jgi:hypothetical protein